MKTVVARAITRERRLTKRLAYATRGGMGEYKNPHAVTLGRLGGRAAAGKGARALAAKRTPQERSDAARVAINARWAKVREARVHDVDWHGVLRGTDEDPREVGWCETCGAEVHDGQGPHVVRDADLTPGECGE